MICYDEKTSTFMKLCNYNIEN